ncbi:hypothetical protein FBR43_05610 [Sphingomonas baiyangensis]|uniref:Uncharacterized protein n=2 Tax=Sphingomonas baiyangensis TaxID=2572576 RepID=A0A4U1L115_9SPHN|nr:hypothetical protein FBR43_05610 [Sphingomonas baiyangensis]
MKQSLAANDPKVQNKILSAIALTNNLRSEMEKLAVAPSTLWLTPRNGTTPQLVKWRPSSEAAHRSVNGKHRSSID